MILTVFIMSSTTDAKVNLDVIFEFILFNINVSHVPYLLNYRYLYLLIEVSDLRSALHVWGDFDTSVVFVRSTSKQHMSKLYSHWICTSCYSLLVSPQQMFFSTAITTHEAELSEWMLTVADLWTPIAFTFIHSPWPIMLILLHVTRMSKYSERCIIREKSLIWNVF